MFIDPPTVDTLSQRDVIEERNISITCTATPGNPSFMTFWWTKVDNPGFIENGATIQLSNIQRNSSGTYRCTAENNYSNGKKGTDSQLTVVNVQCRSLMSNTQSYIYFCMFFFTNLKRFFLMIFRFICVYQSGLCSSIITQETLKCHWSMINHMFCLVSRNNNLVVHIHINDWLMSIIIDN